MVIKRVVLLCLWLAVLAPCTSRVLANQHALARAGSAAARSSNPSAHVTDFSTASVWPATYPAPLSPGVSPFVGQAVVSLNPTDQTVNAGDTATFIAAAHGSPLPTVQWQVSTDGGATFGVAPGDTSNSTDRQGFTITSTFSFSATATQNGNQYRAVFTNTATATTTAATLTVHAAPVVTTNPNNQTVTVGSTATFAAAASGSPAPVVQWQVSTNAGATFTDIGAASSTTLTVLSVTSGMSGNQYRAVFKNVYGTATTTAATLTVNKQNQTIAFPAIAPHTFGDASFTVSATATSGLAVTFSYAGGPCTVTGANGSTITITGAGTCTIHADQAGNATYNAAPTVSRTVVIAKATPVVAWNAPAAISYGTLLSSIQLNATASANGNPVPGVFTYTPPAGTKLNVGPAQPLSVSFAPTDTADFTGPILGSTTISVNKAATSTSLSSNATSATLGQHITFTAHVTSSGGTPSGTVGFYDTTNGSVFLGSGTLAGGSATFSTNLLSAGTHSIMASYQGDTNFLSSQSTPLTQVVATCSVYAVLLEGAHGTLNAFVAGTTGLVNTNSVQFSGPDGSFRLTNTSVVSCANPGAANSSAIVVGTASGTAAGAYQLGDQMTLTLLNSGAGGKPEVDIADITHTHAYALTSTLGGVGSIMIATS